MEDIIQPYTHNVSLADCLAKTADLIAYNRSQESIVKFEKILPSTNNHLLIALSGGTDSTALLVALSQIAPSYKFQLSACHINHDLRGNESEKDAEFCQNLCQQLKIKCKVIKLDGLSQSATNQEGHYSEEFLRERRYECLINYARQENISFVLTAHTLDDQAETLLFRLFRGTSITGLKGIDACRELSRNLYLLRPLLKLSKTQCQNYLKRQGIEARQDSSNLNEVYTRNYIRHQVIPVINRRFPDFFTHLDCLRDIIASEDKLLEKISIELLTKIQSDDTNIWSAKTLREEALSLQRRALALSLKERSIAVSFNRIDEIIALLKQKTDLPIYLNLNKNWRLKYIDNKLFWQKIRGDNHSPIKFDPLEVKVPGPNLLAALNILLTVEDYPTKGSAVSSFDKNLNGNAKSRFIFADLSRIKPPLLLRQRLPGDKISPLGMSQSVKLKKYIHTHKKGDPDDPLFNSGALLADQEEVIWLPGIGMSEKIKVNDVPSHILKWQLSNTGDSED